MRDNFNEIKLQRTIQKTLNNSSTDKETIIFVWVENEKKCSNNKDKNLWKSSLNILLEREEKMNWIYLIVY